MSNRKLSKKQGFTLVELSIVIIIIGFLIAGVAAGTSLIKQAALNSVTSDLTNFRTAVNSFKARYNALPGDMQNAYAYFGAACGTDDVGGADSCNGNGDGNITTAAPWISPTPYEDLKAWQHLSLAGLIQGQYSGVIVGDRESPGINTPGSKVQGGAYSFALESPQAYYGVSVDGKNMITFGKLREGLGVYNNGILSPTDGQSLDNKMDDGNNLSGNILIVGAHDDWGSGNKCTVDAWLSGTAGQLNFANNDANCRLLYTSGSFQRF
jgi:prepilin-type N-terminal cleavage/methylation domain-containing protein